MQPGYMECGRAFILKFHMLHLRVIAHNQLGDGVVEIRRVPSRPRFNDCRLAVFANHDESANVCGGSVAAGIQIVNANGRFHRHAIGHPHECAVRETSGIQRCKSIRIAMGEMIFKNRFILRQCFRNAAHLDAIRQFSNMGKFSRVKAVYKNQPRALQ